MAEKGANGVASFWREEETMRCDQEFGLTAEARKYLESYARKIEAPPACPHCGKLTRVDFEKKECGQYYGMFGDEYPLMEYTLHNGVKAREIVQAEPWSSGPCFFLCLLLENGTRIGEWRQSEIDNA